MKQKWYRSNITKTILIALEHILVGVMAVSILWMLAYPAVRDEMLEGNPAKRYEDSRNFGNLMTEYASQVSAGIGTKEMFETDGKFNPDKLVDIQEYDDSTTISGKDSSGLCYRLGDLLAWNSEGVHEQSEEKQDHIIVCKKTDGTFYYYKSSEFIKLVESGTLRFIISGEAQRTTTDIINQLMSKTYDKSSSQTEFKGLQNADGEMVYIDCWNYDGYVLNEFKKPEGAESILDIVNHNLKWNGHLEDIYRMLENTIYGVGDLYAQYEYAGQNLAEGDTNLTYLYANPKTGQIYTNKKELENAASVETSLETIRRTGKYVIVYPKLADFETNVNHMDASAWRNMIGENGGNTESFVFAVCVDTAFPIQDNFYLENRLYSQYGSSAGYIIIALFLAILLFVAGLVWLIWIAGRSAKDEELHLCRFDHWKTEVAALLVIGVWLVPALVGVKIASSIPMVPSAYTDTTVYSYQENVSYLSNSVPYLIVGAAVAAYTCAMFLIGVLSLTRRIKAGRVWKDSVLRSVCTFVKQIFDHLQCVWKTAVLFGGFVIIHWIAYMMSRAASSPEPLLLALIADVAAFVYLIRYAIGNDKLKTGIRKISEGEVDYKIPMEKLYGTQKAIAEDINSISEGLDAAVEKSMKSERLKTDLITNVSHDIKTPLTSIINYIDLLKQENLEDPKIQHYIEVLEQKAQRLKTLTEDVVEASKVSSGNISLEYMTLNLTEMIQQTSGEFAEKFAARDLTEVMNIQDGDALIRADGRRTWRILENIYNNAAKYAMKGTRVYADLKMTENTVIFNLKNISEHPLNFAADELTERFIRGDVSRSTEGSGLGLSIAKTLTQMQGGTFELYLDGDLFKVMITFPKVEKINNIIA